MLGGGESRNSEDGIVRGRSICKASVVRGISEEVILHSLVREKLEPRRTILHDRARVEEIEEAGMR